MLRENHPVNILHISPYYAPAWAFGGVVSALHGLATAQVERGHRVTVLTTDALDFEHRNAVRRETLAGVIVLRCPNVSHALRAKYNLSSPRSWRRALQTLQPDVVHVHELRTVENLLTVGWASPRPVILSPHGTLGYEAGRSVVKHWWDRLFGVRLARRISHIAALTAAELDEAQALWSALRVPLPTVRIIPNGIRAELPAQVAQAADLRARFKLGAGPVVLFFGRLHERKGLQFLIPAFAQASASTPDARLLIAGPDAGMLETAQALVSQLRLADRVVFAGMLTGEDRFAALKTADLFALPAIGEGLSMASLEALAAGLPLVLTPGCNLPEVESRRAGVVVAREVAPLAAALESLLKSPDQRRAMGERGRKWASTEFIWPSIAERAESLYQEALQQGAIRR